MLRSDDQMLYQYLSNEIATVLLPRFSRDETISSVEFIEDIKDSTQSDEFKAFASTSTNSSNFSVTDNMIDEDLFITLVSERPALYDSSLNLKSRTKPIKDRLWLEIQNYFAMSIIN